MLHGVGVCKLTSFWGDLVRANVGIFQRRGSQRSAGDHWPGSTASQGTD